MKKRTFSLLLFFSILLMATFVNITAFAALSYSNYQTVNVDSYQSFRNSVLGHAYNTDGAHGAQCWDGANILWLRGTGRGLQTGTGYARGCWESKRDVNAGTEFELITSIGSVQRGDVVVFGGSTSGHIAFADENYNGSGSLSILGQNQGSNRTPTYDSCGCYESAFNISSHSTASFLGAFRYKAWKVAPSYTNYVHHWAWGFKNKEGNNSDKKAFHLGDTSWKGQQGTSQTYTKNMQKSIRGFKCRATMGSGSFSGKWTDYTIPYTFTQPAFDTGGEYDYDPIEYKITYALGGGKNNSSNPSSYNILYGVTLSSPTKTGYTFSGWKDESGNTVTGINKGANASFSSVDDFYNKINSRTIGNKTLTAQWTPNTYKVTFNANGGSTSTASKNVTYDSTYGTLPTPTLTGYTFNGWYTAKSGGTKITSSSKVTITAAQTLYAQWSLTPYTNSVHHWVMGFKNQEGNNSKKNAFSLGQTTWTGKYGTSQTYTKDMIKTVRGFKARTQMGSSAFATEWTNYDLPYTFSQPAKNTAAQYTYDPIKYTINYVLNGGTNNDANPASYNILYGVSFANPTRKGYEFKGWIDENGNPVTGINEGCNATFENADDFYNKINSRTIGAKTLTAQWEMITLTETTITNKSNYSMFDIKVHDADKGDRIIISTFKNGNLADTQIEIYNGEDISAATFKPFDSAKIMLWKSAASLSPISKPEIIENK